MIVDSGFAPRYLFSSLATLLILAAWLALVLFTLLALRRRPLPAIAKAIWALIILGLPAIGAIGFWIVQPNDSPSV